MDFLPFDVRMIAYDAVPFLLGLFLMALYVKTAFSIHEQGKVQSAQQFFVLSVLSLSEMVYALILVLIKWQTLADLFFEPPFKATVLAGQVFAVGAVISLVLKARLTLSSRELNLADQAILTKKIVAIALAELPAILGLVGALYLLFVGL